MSKKGWPWFCVRHFDRSGIVTITDSFLLPPVRTWSFWPGFIPEGIATRTVLYVVGAWACTATVAPTAPEETGWATGT